jgi:hypothetical protein
MKTRIAQALGLAALAGACDPPATGSAPSAASSAAASGEAPGSNDAICAALASRAPFELASCKTKLRRERAADGAMVSYLPCMAGPCPVALERDGKLGAIAVQNLVKAHFFTGKKRSVLVVETRFVKAEGKRTSGSVAVITLDGAEPVRAEDFPADDIDATNPDHVVSRVVAIEVSRSEIRLKGKVDEQGKGGALLGSKAVDETHALPTLD